MTTTTISTTAAARAEQASKIYGAGDTAVHALDAIDVAFEHSRYSAWRKGSGIRGCGKRGLRTGTRCARIRTMKRKPAKSSRRHNDDLTLAMGRALRRAARRARETARIHGTPIYISRNGKLVAIKP